MATPRFPDAMRGNRFVSIVSPIEIPLYVTAATSVEQLRCKCVTFPQQLKISRKTYDLESSLIKVHSQKRHGLLSLLTVSISKPPYSDHS
jgi:hypothetical protein